MIRLQPLFNLTALCLTAALLLSAEEPRTAPRTGKSRPAQGSADWVAAAKPTTKTSPAFTLTSSAVKDGGDLPVEFTGDGEGVSPPLTWSNVPKGTQSLVLIMHHLDPEGRTKIYWLVHDIAPTTLSAGRNDSSFGKMGMSTVHDRVEYAPPHSKGPGTKKYVLTLFALSAKPDLSKAPMPITAETVLAACQGKILAATDLNVAYTRSGAANDRGGKRPGGDRPEAAPAR